jgi:hypothetical protein
VLFALVGIVVLVVLSRAPAQELLLIDSAGAPVVRAAVFAQSQHNEQHCGYSDRAGILILPPETAVDQLKIIAEGFEPSVVPYPSQWPARIELGRPRPLSVAFSSWSDLAVTSASGHFRGRRVGRADLEAYVRDAAPSRNIVRVSLNRDAAVDPAEIVQFFRRLGFLEVEVLGPDGELRVDTT